MAVTARRDPSEVEASSRESTDASAGSGSRPRKALTIGAVAKILGQEFEDISISKIRYLEDQKLLAPRRTQGGYRLYSQADVERLQTILRMQRDEFLPLRVIRQELATGDFSGRRPSAQVAKRRASSVEGPTAAFGIDQLVEEAGVKPEFVRELQDFGIVQPPSGAPDGGYDETDVEIVRAAAELARFGVAGRNLRVFRTSVEREASLLEQIVGAALRSRSQARRKEAIENLESLAAVCGHLKHLLLIRDLRRLKGDA